MTCKKCGNKMNYDFHIANSKWEKIIKKFGKDTILCAHCALEFYGLEMWEIRSFGYEYWEGKRIR